MKLFPSNKMGDTKGCPKWSSTAQAMFSDPWSAGNLKKDRRKGPVRPCTSRQFNLLLNTPSLSEAIQFSTVSPALHNTCGWQCEKATSVLVLNSWLHCCHATKPLFLVGMFGRCVQNPAASSHGHRRENLLIADYHVWELKRALNTNTTGQHTDFLW